MVMTSSTDNAKSPTISVNPSEIGRALGRLNAGKPKKISLAERRRKAKRMRDAQKMRWKPASQQPVTAEPKNSPCVN
jgi:hypothetical protein